MSLNAFKNKVNYQLIVHKSIYLSISGYGIEYLARFEMPYNTNWVTKQSES